MTLTHELPLLLLQAGLDVALQLSECGGFEGLEVDLDLVGVRVPQRRLSGLDNVDDAAQLLARQPVDVQAQLALLVVRHGQGRLLAVVAVGRTAARCLAAFLGLPENTLCDRSEHQKFDPEQWC